MCPEQHSRGPQVATSPNLGGYSNQVTPTTTLNQTLTNIGVDIDSVIYHILPQKNACIGNDTHYIVRVMPIPALTNNPVNKTICDSTFSNLALLSNNSNTCSPGHVHPLHRFLQDILITPPPRLC